MSMEDATRLTEAFAQISKLDDEGVQIFGNIDWKFVTPESPLGSWMPAIEATFDTGILVISRVQRTCLWVEDED